MTGRARIFGLVALVVVIGAVFLWQYAMIGSGRRTPLREPGELVGRAEALDLFNKNCEGCHGPTRAGATGPALLPETVGEKDKDFLAMTIRNGRPGTAMPAFQDRLTNAQVASLVEFIKSPPLAPPRWTFSDIEKSRKVFIKKEDLPDKPTHSSEIGNLFFVVERDVSRGAFVDGNTWRVVREHPLGFAVHEAEYSPDGRFAYLIARNGLLTKIDLFTLDRVAQVRAGLNARGVAVSRDGKFIAVSNYLPFTMAIFRSEDLKPLKVIKLEGIDPDGKRTESRGAAVTDARRYGFFMIALKEAGQVWMIDYKAPDFPVAAKIPAGRILHDFFWDSSERYWMGASQTDNAIVVIDAETKGRVAKIPTGIKPHPGPGANWESRGRKLSATVHIGEGKLTVWEEGTWRVVGEVKTAGPGLFLRTHPRSKYVITDVFAGDQKDVVHVHDKDTFEIVKTLRPAPGKTTIHPEFTNDGRFFVVSVWDREGELVVYDAETLEEVRRVKGLITPTGTFNVGNRTPQQHREG